MKYLKRKSVSKPIQGSILDTKNIENKTLNTYSSNIINELIESSKSTLLDLVYPIGRGFIDFTDTDYSNYLGFTWERELIGMTPIGKNTNDSDFATVGKTGGTKTVKLTVEQIPSHSHTLNRQQWYTADIAISDNSGAIFSWKTTEGGSTSKAYSKQAGSYDIGFTGSSQAHTNLPPYQVVSYWKRIK